MVDSTAVCFLAVARKHLPHLFPEIPGQAGYFKRRRKLGDTLEWLMSVFASQSPGSMTTCCAWIPRQWSAPGAVRR
jgi:hypothetical protein